MGNCNINRQVYDKKKLLAKKCKYSLEHILNQDLIIIGIWKGHSP